MRNLWTKHALLVTFDQKCFVWVFLGKNFLKNYFPYLKSAPSNLSIIKILQKKTKCLDLGPKMPVWSIVGLEFQKVLGISGLKLEKNLAIFAISTLEFV